jgi:hypothetical protein
MYAAKNRSEAQRPTEAVVVLKSSPVAQEAIKEINEGKSLTIKDVQERLRCEKDKAIRLFRREPGVTKIGKSYLIPQFVFDRVLARNLVV